MTNTATSEGYVFEGVQEEFKDDRLEKFKHDLNNDLARTFQTKGRPYNNVQVLLLCWDQADSNNHEDVIMFKDFLENEFRYQTQIYKILGNNSGQGEDLTDLGDVLLDFKNRSTPTTLNIIYYSGHGYSNASFRKPSDIQKDLIIYPTKELDETLAETRAFGLDYHWIYQGLFTIPGAILHILDTCCGGGAALATSHEILAAGSYNTRTQGLKSLTQPSEIQSRAQEPHSHFLRRLIPTMAELLKERGSFTAEECCFGP